MEIDAQLAPLEDACTVVIVRDGEKGLETLMLERPASSSSFGGAWVFPGGKVDPEDRVSPAGAVLDELAAARVAGLRELHEETGQQLRPEELIWLSQWTPMQAIPRRFRTWFMLAPATTDEIVLNPAEHQRHAWLTPAQALAKHARGEMKLVPPTWVTLHNLDGVPSVQQALTGAREHAAFSYNTHLLLPQDGSRPSGVLWAGDEAYPATDGTPDVSPDGTAGGTAGVAAGSRHRLTMTGLPWVFEHSS